MKFIDLFSGIGGFRLGMESAGHECVAFCEIDKFARASYKAIHDTTGEIEYHDITSVTDEEWRKFRGTVDVICGGFPCQAFSVAGKRQGFLDETRGTLFFEIARAAKQIKPRILFLENVKGLLSHDKGRTFGIILNTLDELGYDCEWQVLNSKNFGVPQNRERVFIIGHFRGERGREVFPIGESNRETNDRLKIKIVGNTNNSGNGQKSAVYSADGIMSCLMSTDYKQPKQIVVVNKENGMPRETNRVYSPEGLSPTLNTMQGGGEGPKIVQKPRGYNKGGEHEVAPTLSSNSWHENNLLKLGGIYTGTSDKFRSKPMLGISRTLKANKHDAGIFDGVIIRKLTPRECWRLQGFPDLAFDKAQEVNSNSQLYKQAGNSVTVNVIAEIAKKFERAI